MRQLITLEFLTIDGVIQAGGGRNEDPSGDIPAQVAHLKRQPGPDLHVYGSANLLQTLLKHDLVDELWLKIYPLTLGTGKRLFAEGTIPAAFQVTESQVSPSGIIIVNYARAGAVTTGDLADL